MGWTFDNSRPIYWQLAQTIKNRIISGEYQPGQKLPTVRELAATAGVNPNTVQRALADLEREGILYTQRTSGRFVSENVHILSEMQREAARALTFEYLTKLKQLGISLEDALLMIDEVKEEYHG